MYRGCPGTWEASPSPSKETARDAGRAKSQASRPQHTRREGANRCAGWYRRAEETKRGGMEGEESERLVVPRKRGNRPHRDPVEGRGRRMRDPNRRQTKGYRALNTVSTKLNRIAKLAREMPEVAITSLSHNIDIEWLREAWRRTRKDGAPGVDGQTAQEYERDLEGNLQSLLDRAKSGRYKAPPVKRVHIPKGTGSETRPLGIPTLEDKVLQRSVAMCLSAVYEQSFLDCSYGFRPRRSAHQALSALRESVMDMGQVWVVEVDIRRFFDSLDHSYLREILRERVRDGVILRLIGKWLNAGVLEGTSLSYPSSGAPQGGVISPLLANIYLHHVLDDWIAKRVAPRLKGPVRLIRYADDFVLVFRSEDDARRVYAALPERFAEYGLKLHPSKTRLIDFRQPPYSRKKKPKVSFDFLGFTLFWGRSRKGGWIVQWKTARDRFTRAVARIGAWCRRHRHAPLRWQHAALCRKVRGHYGYFGLTGNARSLRSFLAEVRRLWCKWLSRRNSRARVFWTRFRKIEAHYPLPPVRVIHSIYRHAANP